MEKGTPNFLEMILTCKCFFFKSHTTKDRKYLTTDYWLPGLKEGVEYEEYGCGYEKTT